MTEEEERLWDIYHLRKHHHDEFFEKTKPKKEDYGYDGYWPSELQHDAYIKAFNEWNNAYFTGHPDKPGYYRSNDD